jgi:hypothetical protein
MRSRDNEANAIHSSQCRQFDGDRDVALGGWPV